MMPSDDSNTGASLPDSSSSREIAVGGRLVALKRFDGLELRLDTPKGRGVFATSSIASGTVVDICPVLLLSPEDNAHVSQSVLYHYSYNWPVRIAHDKAENVAIPTRTSTKMQQAIILGLGSMFNHSSKDQNVSWTRDLENETVIYKAIRNIEVGEELCISYGSVLWFSDTDAEDASALSYADAENEEDLLAVYMSSSEDGEGADD